MYCLIFVLFMLIQRQVITMPNRNIDSYFKGVIENIDIILNNDFYKKEDKHELISVKNKIISWQENYKTKKSLIGIDPKDLEYIDLEITDIFDKYMIAESYYENYTERLSFDISQLESAWKEEMLRRNK